MVKYSMSNVFKNKLYKAGWRFNGERWFCPKEHSTIKILTAPSEKIRDAEQMFTLECSICGAIVVDEVELKKLEKEADNHPPI